MSNNPTLDALPFQVSLLTSRTADLDNRLRVLDDHVRDLLQLLQHTNREYDARYVPLHNYHRAEARLNHLATRLDDIESAIRSADPRA